MDYQGHTSISQMFWYMKDITFLERWNGSIYRKYISIVGASYCKNTPLLELVLMIVFFIIDRLT